MFWTLLRTANGTVVIDASVVSSVKDLAVSERLVVVEGAVVDISSVDETGMSTSLLVVGSVVLSAGKKGVTERIPERG